MAFITKIVFVFALAHEGYLLAVRRVGRLSAVGGAAEVLLVGAVFGVHGVDLLVVNVAYLPFTLAHEGDLFAVGRVCGEVS